jgi:hypothetical protein
LDFLYFSILVMSPLAAVGASRSAALLGLNTVESLELIVLAAIVASGGCIVGLKVRGSYPTLMDNSAPDRRSIQSQVLQLAHG